MPSTEAFQDKVAWEPKKGEEVLVHPDNPEDGDPAVATITKVGDERDGDEQGMG